MGKNKKRRKGTLLELEKSIVPFVLQQKDYLHTLCREDLYAVFKKEYGGNGRLFNAYKEEISFIGITFDSVPKRENL